jgi:hypothetical protein
MIYDFTGFCAKNHPGHWTVFPFTRIGTEARWENYSTFKCIGNLGLLPFEAILYRTK